MCYIMLVFSGIGDRDLLLDSPVPLYISVMLTTILIVTNIAVMAKSTVANMIFKWKHRKNIKASVQRKNPAKQIERSENQFKTPTKSKLEALESVEFPLAVINQSVAPENERPSSVGSNDRPRSSDMKGLNSFLAISENTHAMGGHAQRAQLPDIPKNQVGDEKEDVLEDLNQLNNLLYATKDYGKKGEWSKPVADLPSTAKFNEVEVKTKSETEPQRFNMLSESKSLSSVVSENQPQAKPQKQE